MDLDQACRRLVRQLHDEIRADIPDRKMFGFSLLPPPWSEKRIGKVADLVAEAIRTGIAESRDVPLKRVS